MKRSILDYLFGEPSKNIKRDLEELLNTRCCCISFDDNLKELNVSLINYGSRDCIDKNICRHIEQTIYQHDSRFKQIKVKLQDDSFSSNNVLCLHIEAILYAEPVIFSSMLNKSSRDFHIMAVG